MRAILLKNLKINTRQKRLKISTLYTIQVKIKYSLGITIYLRMEIIRFHGVKLRGKSNDKCLEV